MSFEQLKKSIDDLGKIVHDFKKDNDAELKEIKSRGNADPLLKEKVDKQNDAIDKALERLAAVETAMNRKEMPADQNGYEGQKSSKEAKAALNTFLRKGEGRLSNEQQNLLKEEAKAMNVGSDPDGGFFVTPEVSSEIIKKVFESSPVRQLASAQTISTDSLEIYEDLDEAEVKTVGETEARGETNTPDVGMIVIPVHEMYAEPHATQKFLDDAAINVEAWLSEKVSSKMARKEATQFMVGTGVKEARGMLTYAAGTGLHQIEQVVSGHASQFTADGLIDLVYALKEAYAANASWMIQRASIKGIRKLKDGQNQYLWGVGLNGPASQSLLGYPLYQAADVPLVAANALAAVFGDIRAAYQIVDRVGIRVLRDPYTKKGFIKFYTTKRVGGDVKNFEAIKIQKIST